MNPVFSLQGAETPGKREFAASALRLYHLQANPVMTVSDDCPILGLNFAPFTSNQLALLTVCPGSPGPLTISPKWQIVSHSQRTALTILF